MIDLFLSEFKQPSLLISMIAMILIYLITIIFWPTFMLKFGLKKYQGVQRVHVGEVPRTGGLISVIGIFLYWMICTHGKAMPFLEALLISSIPLVVISIKEDFFHNTRASSRLLMMFLSCFLFFYLYDINFPQIEFPGLGPLIDSSIFMRWLFFAVSVVVIINGNNLIDGANGLMPMSIIMQSISLFFICLSSQDMTNMIRLIYILTPMLIFLLFNYPWGKVFMGDLGAYFFGFFISLLTIVIFGEHPDLPTWGAVIILFYPALELLFSVCRKIYEGKNPMQPDPHHLHLKMFYFLKQEGMKSRVSNGLVMPCIALIWGMPFVLVVWVYQSLTLTIIALFMLLTIYIGFYWALPRKK
jgi:UDP-N-acetylmuramyl pentapeptide phosphotransferase/UDP-N-acetylglucosamine-1-phosphate transferase